MDDIESTAFFGLVSAYDGRLICSCFFIIVLVVLYGSVLRGLYWLHYLTQQQQKNIQDFKLVIVGESRVGKTTFIKQHLVEEKKYKCEMGVEHYRCIFQTNRGRILFNVCETTVSS